MTVTSTVYRDQMPPTIKHTIPTASTNPKEITVTAEVYDDLAVSSVSLYYKNAESPSFTSVPMTAAATAAAQYSAAIPKAAFDNTSRLQYYFEASDGVNVTRLPADSSVNYEIAVFPAGGPMNSELLITELMNDNKGTDNYEYVEVYNNTDRAINLKDYRLLYVTQSTATTPWDIDTDLLLSPQQTALIWVKSYAMAERPISEFVKHHGLQLPESRITSVVAEDESMNNDIEGRVYIATDAGKVTSQAWFNVAKDETTTEARTFVYEYPKDGTTRMYLRAYGQTPTPGTLLSGQVPEQPISIAADTQKPVISHTPPTAPKAYGSVVLETYAADNHEITQIKVFYKRDGQASYTAENMTSAGGGLYRSPSLKSQYFLLAEHVDYYFEASDGIQKRSSLDDTAGVPYRMYFAKPQYGPVYMNIQDGTYIRGTKVIEGNSLAGGNQLQLSIDGTAVPAQVTMPGNAYILFEADDMQDSFKNGLLINDKLVRILGDGERFNEVVYTLPKLMFTPGNNTVSIAAGTTKAYDDQEGNNDDFRLQNTRIVLWDGTYRPIITARIKNATDGTYTTVDPLKVVTVGDGSNNNASSKTRIDYSIDIPNDAFRGVSYSLDSKKYPDGEHLLQTTSSSGDQLTVKAIIDNTPPVVESMTLADGQTYRGELTFDAVASDEVSGVKSKELTLDGKPVEAGSKKYGAELEPGSHVLQVKVRDNAGNETVRAVTFTLNPEHPLEPADPQPVMEEEGAHQNAKLSVKVNDPNGDPLDVTFYEAYQYDFSGDSAKTGFKNSTDREPPLELVPAGETPFSQGDAALVQAKDKQYLSTESTMQFPYHRFDFKMTHDVAPTDEVEVVWVGHSLPDRQVTLYTWNFNTQKWEAGARGVGTEDFELKAKVNAGDMVRGNTIHVLVQDLIPSPDEVDFTFAWVSDTQYYSESYPQVYDKMMRYLVEQKQQKKIIYTIHTGDLIDEYDKPEQWAVADKSMKYLENAGMNYGVVAGNHDVGHSKGDYSIFSQYFGRDRFVNQPTYGGDNADNRDHYDLVSSNGHDFLIMYLGYGVKDDTVKWANDVLKKYPDRYAIIATHAYITPSGAYGEDGQKIWSEIVAANKNVFMVLCGHYHGAAYNVKHVDGRTVVELLSDYQSGREGGQGYLRFLQFDLDNQKIHVNTYSPYLNDWNFFDEPGKDEFDVDYPTRPIRKQVATDYIGVNVYTRKEIGTASSVPSGSTAGVKWKHLDKNNTYYWYTTARDAYHGQTVSDIWKFSTKAKK
ncbi:metallophosphoesterase [Paenibacillus allorhizosphaerae]|nr:metallophosphoesterase [Paenibacillus allorhizosphaerae]